MFYNAFPNYLREELNIVLEILPKKTFNNVDISTSDDVIEYTLDESVVEIPYRMYLLDVADAEYEKLSKTQKQILCCIYTRSCNGYIREKYLRKLLDMPLEQWGIPFIVKLCDEYVLEILEIMYSKLKERNNTDIQIFCFKNKALINISNFDTITAEKDDNENNVVVVNGSYIIGQYNTVEDCVAVIDWIATSLGEFDGVNLTIKMPNEVYKNETKA